MNVFFIFSTFGRQQQQDTSSCIDYQGFTSDITIKKSCCNYDKNPVMRQDFYRNFGLDNFRKVLIADMGY